MFRENTAQFSTVVLVETQTLPNRVILVSLTEFADLSTCKNFLFSRLEVRLDNQSPIVDQSIFVNNIENLTIDVDESASDEETRWGFNLYILSLL